MQECLTLQHEVVAQMDSFRRFHTHFMKMWDEKDNAVEELEKLKMANKSNKAVVIIQDDDDDEHEPNCRQFHYLPTAGYTDVMKPEKFTGGMGFKRWQIKFQLWLEAMNMWEVSNGLPEGTISDDVHSKFKKDTTIFRGCILSVLDDRLCDVYMHIKDGKELWDALTARFDATDADSELYIMESFHDYKRVNNRGMVKQAHEI